jgi:hypothetical protein
MQSEQIMSCSLMSKSGSERQDGGTPETSKIRGFLSTALSGPEPSRASHGSGAWA